MSSKRVETSDQASCSFRQVNHSREKRKTKEGRDKGHKRDINTMFETGENCSQMNRRNGTKRNHTFVSPHFPSGIS